MYTLQAFLTDFSWLGPFLCVGVFAAIERAFPRATSAAIARSPNLVFGVTTALTAIFCAIAVADVITRFAFNLQVVSLAAMPLPDWAKIVIGILLIDLIVYANHRVLHRFGLLWRIHKIHHSDPGMSASTGLLQHPFETLWNFAWLLAANVFLGVPLGAILIYSAVNTIHFIFVHSDISLPPRASDAMSWVFVTPDMHVVHHSLDMREGNSNFGSLFSIWDRMFGTLIEKPRQDIPAMQLGIADARDGKSLKIVPLLLLPFRRNG